MKNRFKFQFSLLLALSTINMVGFKPTTALAVPITPTFAPKGGGFSVWLPGKPNVSVKPMQMPGKGTVNVQFYTLDSSPISYVLVPMDLPGKLTGADISGFLTGAQKGFLRSASAKLLSTQNITLNGYRGRAILAESGTNLMRARIFAAGRRSYQLMAVAPRTVPPAKSAEMAKVFNSFRITS